MRVGIWLCGVAAHVDQTSLKEKEGVEGRKEIKVEEEGDHQRWKLGEEERK